MSVKIFLGYGVSCMRENAHIRNLLMSHLSNKEKYRREKSQAFFFFLNPKSTSKIKDIEDDLKCMSSSKFCQQTFNSPGPGIVGKLYHQMLSASIPGDCCF